MTCPEEERCEGAGYRQVCDKADSVEGDFGAEDGERGELGYVGEGEGHAKVGEGNGEMGEHEEDAEAGEDEVLFAYCCGSTLSIALTGRQNEDDSQCQTRMTKMAWTNKSINAVKTMRKDPSLRFEMRA